MASILLINQKGGVGKSTIADEIAFSFERSGYKTAFYDFDAQGSTIHGTINEPDAEISVIDTPGHFEKGQNAIDIEGWIKEVDLVVIPTLATHREFNPLMLMFDIMDKHPDKKVVYIINQYSGYTLAQEFLDWFRSARPNDKVVTLKKWEPIVRAGMEGKSVVTYSPSSKAAAEVIEVVNTVREAIGYPKEQPPKKWFFRRQGKQ